MILTHTINKLYVLRKLHVVLWACSVVEIAVFSLGYPNDTNPKIN